jgi:hypothetical protein
MLEKLKPAALASRRASVSVNIWQPDGPENNRHARTSKAIRADLIGSDTCTAFGITSGSSSPVLALCRALIEAGYDPSTPLEAYRGNTLALRIRSIGEAATLEVSGEGTGFRRRRQPDAGPPMRQNRWVAS